MDLKINAGTFISVIAPSTTDKNMKTFLKDIEKYEKRNIAVNHNVMEGTNFNINVNYATHPLYMSTSYNSGDFEKITGLIDELTDKKVQKGGGIIPSGRHCINPTFRYKYQKYKNKYMDLLQQK